MKKYFAYIEKEIRSGEYKHTITGRTIDGVEVGWDMFYFDADELKVWVDIYARQSKESVYFFDGIAVYQYVNGELL